MTDPSSAQRGSNKLTSVISADLLIVGDVKSSGDIQVDGTIKGDVDCSKLTISESGMIEGKIIAEQVVIHGAASGSIVGRSVMLHKTAKVGSDIHHQGIGIEMGTRYEGTLKWAEDHELEQTASGGAPKLEQALPTGG
ncbi:MAG: polymer-forming cytoskeletal protein [Pseudomonadota bacterium]